MLLLDAMPRARYFSMSRRHAVAALCYVDIDALLLMPYADATPLPRHTPCYAIATRLLPLRR